MFPKELPDFQGYTIDFRLKQFRKINREKLKIEFINFESPEGRKLLTKYYESLI